MQVRERAISFDVELAHPFVNTTAALFPGLTMKRWRTILNRAAIAVALAGSAVLWAEQTVPGSGEDAAVFKGDSESARRFVRSLRLGLDHVAGEIIVRFRDGTGPTRQAALVQRSIPSSGDIRVTSLGDASLVEVPDTVTIDTAVEALSRESEVEYAQPNYIRQPTSTPNDSLFAQQWHMDAINMPAAWDINPGSRSDVLVAVLDGGLTTAQGTFVFRIWDGRQFGGFPIPFAPASDFDHSRVRTGAEFTETGGWRTPQGAPLFFDLGGHGTHVAGTIGQQTNNGFAYSGVAYAATLLPVKVCASAWDVQLAAGAIGIPGRASADDGGCSDASVIQGIRYAADQGAKVINISLGKTQPAPAVAAALRYATSQGTFVAISAGNDALTGNRTDYPAAYAADIEGVMSVGAVGRSLRRAAYSTFGAYVEIAAPGGDCSQCNDSVWQVGPNQADLSLSFVSPRADRYVQFGIAGTSMAAPHVAGVAALLYGQGLTRPAAIEAAIKAFARDLGPSGKDPEYGYGLVDARATLRGLGLAR